jgi:alkylation response protein AidB-like acyl-CoA dehydrogenase
MDFGLSEEQELLQATVQGFVERECPPTRVRELFDAGGGHDPGLWKGLAELGVAGLCVPEAFGGAGLEVLELALAAEVLGGGCVPGPFLGHSLACLALALGGSAAQRERWLPALAAGDALASVAFAEDGERWDPEEWRLAPRRGRLDGSKLYVPGAESADLLVVGTRGGGLALVEKGAPGLRCEPLNGVDRGRALSRLELASTPCEPLPPDAGLAARVRDAGLVLLAADAFGAAWRLVQLTVDYTRVREQFGTPLAQFQAVKHQLANMATATETGRGLFWYAAHAQDHLPAEAPRIAAIAKAHIADRALETGRAAVELHGGLGFTWECDVQIWLKRIMFDRAFLGTPERQRERSAALGGF